MPSCIAMLREYFDDLKVSPIYLCAAVGFEGNDFYNAVVSFTTNMKLEAIYKILRTIEQQHGRVRKVNKFISRTLDIDLLLFNDDAIRTKNIQLPNPEITQYMYILFPLADLAPKRKHPILNKSYTDLRQAFQPQTHYEKYDAKALFHHA